MQSLIQWINSNLIIWPAYFKLLDHITSEIALINIINIILMLSNIKNKFVIGALLVINAINIYHMIRYTLIMLSLSPKTIQKDK